MCADHKRRAAGVLLVEVAGLHVHVEGAFAAAGLDAGDALHLGRRLQVLEAHVLLVDHQTTGGYAVPLVVIAADIPDTAQLCPGESVRFAHATLADAALALIAKTAALREALA